MLVLAQGRFGNPTNVSSVHQIRNLRDSQLLRRWSTIYINTQPPFHLARYCVQRARAHPLKIFIDESDPNWSGIEEDGHFKPESMKQLMVFVCSYMDQVSMLTIICDTWAAFLEVTLALQTAPPPRNLRKLALHRKGSAYAKFRTPPPILTQEACRLFEGMPAPRMREAIFTGAFLDYRAEAFQNLRVFEIRKMAVEHMPSFEYLASVFHNSPRLERAIFDGACAKLAVCPVEDLTPVNMPYLRELGIRNLNPIYAIFISTVIRAPELRYLAVGKTPSARDSEPFLKHITGRYPKVTILSVDDLGATDQGLLCRWFHSMTLRFIKLKQVPSIVFEALLQRAPDSIETSYNVICPQLEACMLVDWRTVDFDAFKRFCMARKELHVPLNHIYVQGRDLVQMNEEDKVWLRRSGVLNEVQDGVGSRPELHERYQALWM
jgi:hypothetical protein